MSNYFRYLLAGMLPSLLFGLAGCQAFYENGDIYKNASGKVLWMNVTAGEYEGKTIPHAIDGASVHFGETASQYRWVHVGVTSRVDHDTVISTVALVPDQVPQLHYGDWVKVKFVRISNTDADALKAAVVFDVICPASAPNSCRKAIIWAPTTKSWRYPLGETDEVVPDLNRLTFSKYYDRDGAKLPGISLPQ